MSDLAAALQVAIRVHAAQVDRQGYPYLLHVLRVVEAVSDEAKVVAALHDVVEDGPAWVSEVVAGLGLNGEEFNAALRLTRRADETYKEYVGRIKQPGLGRVVGCEVKLADLRDNLGRIPPRPNVHATEARREWDGIWPSLRARYEKAVAILEAGEPR